MSITNPIVDRYGQPMLPEGDIILSTGPLVGLGDHMVYSTLPKRFAELGYTVYIDEDVAARNDDILDLIWVNNPYVKGPSDKKPNAGYVRQGLFYEIANRYPIGCIEAMERAHGLPPPYGIAPYVSYKPQPFHQDLSDTVLVDLTAVSSNLDDTAIYEFLRCMAGRFRGAPMLQILPPKHAALHGPTVALPTMGVDNLYQYIDMLKGARAYIGSEAGGQSLAAAVRGEHHAYELTCRPEVVVLSTIRTYNARGYTYRGVDYRVTAIGQDTKSDNFFPDEVTRHIYELRCARSYRQMRGLPI